MTEARQTIPEVHVVVLWPIAQSLLAYVQRDLALHVELLGVHALEWPAERFAEGVTRFYGYDVAVRDKATPGTPGPVTVLTLRDSRPEQAPRPRSDGPGLVNARLYDAKQRYRALAGGGYGVHGSVNSEEADRDLFLLLGWRAAAVRDLPPVPADTSPVRLQREVTGGQGWASVAQLLTALELTGACVLLRERPDELALLVDDAARVERLARGLVPLVAGRPVRLDLEVVGDGRQHEGWQQALLRERERDACGLPVAAPQHRLHHRLATRRSLGLPLHDDPDLPGLIVATGAPPQLATDPEWAEASLNDFLRRNGWRLRPPVGRRVRAQIWTARLRARMGRNA